MQASRKGGQTCFNTQKPVVNNYALGKLVLRSQYLLKVLTSIVSRSLTVTDPQPKKNPLRQTNQTKPNQTKPISGFN
jgi:hypothetical protein